MNKLEQRVDQACALLSELRFQNPLVYSLTNDVVIGYTANALLALGAAPAMIHDPTEARQFAAVANSLLINVGTLVKPQAEAMRVAVSSAIAAGKPWVLDPVAVGMLSLRSQVARELMVRCPAIIRGNASEILALGGLAETGRGVDSTAAVDEAQGAAGQLARETGAVVLVTGPVDYLFDPEGNRVASIANGHPMMTRVTGVGCAQGAIAAAFAGVAGGDYITAAFAAGLTMAVAGDIAIEKAQRPGSFQIALLDALDELDADLLRSRAKVSL